MRTAGVARMCCREAILRCCCNQVPHQQQPPRRIAPWKSSMVVVQNEVLKATNSGLESSCVILNASKRRRRVCGEVRWRRACFKRRNTLAGSLPRETESLFQRGVSKVGRGPWLSRNRECLTVNCVDSANESHGEGDLHQPAPEENGAQTTVSESGWLLPSPDVWLQVGIFLIAAGFVDAGFSGDWSRIGVLSNEVEVELQIACIGVVPLAATLIWSISERRKKM